MTDNKRRNFTEREKSALLNIVDKYIYILENKCTNSSTNKKKQEAWESVASEFNAITAEVPRTPKQLATLYLNLKRLSRHTTRENKPERERRTSTRSLSDADTRLSAIMGNQVKPLSSTCDSAAATYYLKTVISDEVEIEEVKPAPLTSSTRSSVVPESIECTKPKKQPKATEMSIEAIKKRFYEKKLQSAILEKRNKLLEYKYSLKRQTLIDLEIKIKQQEYENLVKKAA